MEPNNCWLAVEGESEHLHGDFFDSAAHPLAKRATSSGGGNCKRFLLIRAVLPESGAGLKGELRLRDSVLVVGRYNRERDNEFRAL